jgi:SAM-dependent methyltransferase
MLTISNTIYPEQFDRLEAIIAALQSGKLSQAESLMAAMAQRQPEISSLPERLQTQLFLDALTSRIKQAAETENLYLVPDEGQQIRMFNFMAEKFPVVRYAQEIANTIFLNQIAQEERFVILDIGIGTGQQIAGLIERLAEQKAPTRQITVLGVEPSAESLDKAELRFQQLAQAHGIRIAFTGIQKTVEQLTPDDWTLLHNEIQGTGGKLLLNASFAMHHVQPPPLRTTFFQQLKALEPAVFMMIEPYADYTADSLMERFKNAWHHYGLTFLAIDTIDDASDSEKSTVKQVFFGREMMDVLGAGSRVEQFETAEMWLHRLVQAGFMPNRISHTIPGGFNPLVQIKQAGSYVGFNVMGHPIVSVICAS